MGEMMTEPGIDKIHEYVEALGRMLYSNEPVLTVQTVASMLAVVKCIEAALTSFLIKMKL